MTLSGRRGINDDPAATTISATIALPIVGVAASVTIALRYLDERSECESNGNPRQV